jgi:hypothetical protein
LGILPADFFWIDWVCFSNELTDEASRDFAKHTHDLSRNIWIAFARSSGLSFENAALIFTDVLEACQRTVIEAEHELSVSEAVR